MMGTHEANENTGEYSHFMRQFSLLGQFLVMEILITWILEYICMLYLKVAETLTHNA